MSAASLALRAGALAALLAATATAAAAAGDPKVVPGKWNKRDVPDGWLVIETEHYHVQCQAGKDKADRLAEHLEAMWEVYSDFLPTRRKPETFVLKIFRDRAQFLVYDPSKKTAAAYYNPGTKELVGYDTGIVLGARERPASIALAADVAARFSEEERSRLDQLFGLVTEAYTMDTARVLSHEGWHQYFHMYTVSIVPMPSWLDEGVGDYFFMATRDGESGAGHGYRLGDLNKHRLRTIQRALVNGTTVDFKTLLGFAQQDYYANASVYYAQGWSMVQFLMHHESPERRALIPRLIKDFKDTKNFAKSTDKVFKGLDLGQLDRDWIAWVTSQQVDDPLRVLAAEFGGRLAPEELQTSEENLPVVYKWHLDHPGELFGD
ncbi:MAG TPA: DUF1570 domain-containing protein [Planctomycetota bacterium]|nr:DUF1570 domain-containing protein [Planctomycetota bacterium]